jgi:antitoxin component YwqK of YwqJK toxin-antitoxin module
MRKLLVYIFLILFIGGCIDEKRYGINEITSPNDSITFLKFDMKPITGIVYCQYGDIGRYINGKKDGIHKKWNKFGQIILEIGYENKKENFKKYEKEWFDDGQLMFEGKYYGDLRYERLYFSDGQLSSEILRWEANLNNENISEDFNGKEAKKINVYYPNGKLKLEQYYLGWEETYIKCWDNYGVVINCEDLEDKYNIYTIPTVVL